METTAAHKIIPGALFRTPDNHVHVIRDVRYGHRDNGDGRGLRTSAFVTTMTEERFQVEVTFNY